MHGIIERIDHLKTLIRNHANTDLNEVRQHLDELRGHVELRQNELRQQQPEQTPNPAAGTDIAAPAAPDEEHVGTGTVNNEHLAADTPPAPIAEPAPGDETEPLEPAHSAPDGSTQIGKATA